MRLVCDGTEVSSVEIADTFLSRLRGMLGRKTAGTPLLITGSNSVHSFGMRFAIDVAFLDRSGVVIDVQYLAVNRFIGPRKSATAVLEAAEGSFSKWNLKTGSLVEVR